MTMLVMSTFKGMENWMYVPLEAVTSVWTGLPMTLHSLRYSPTSANIHWVPGTRISGWVVASKSRLKVFVPCGMVSTKFVVLV